jgi:hypothetical protein
MHRGRYNPFMSVFDRKTPAPRTFAEALMGELADHVWEGQTPTPAAPVAETLSEKGLVLESFTRFAAEKVEEAQEGKFVFPGGEIVLKEDETRGPLKPRFQSRDAWMAHQQERLGEAFGALTAGKASPLAVLFVGEALQPAVPPVEGVFPEFLWAFSPPVAELFQKMVQAMRLGPGEYAVTVLRDGGGEKDAEALFEEAHWWGARFVVPLGAQATQALLGARERLASAHGKSFPHTKLPVGSEIVPLFHPGVIATNLNMKKATWADMQKLMRALGRA